MEEQKSGDTGGLKSEPIWDSQDATQDFVVAGGLLFSPAWVPWLTSLNHVLTTVTLVVGLVLGLVRLWVLVRRGRQKNPPSQ